MAPVMETPCREERPVRMGPTTDLPSKILWDRRFPMPAGEDREISLRRADQSGVSEIWIG